MPSPGPCTLTPRIALPGGRVRCDGGIAATGVAPAVRVGGHPALVAASGPAHLTFVVPAEATGENLPVTVDDEPRGTLSVGEAWATGLHQVDSPVFASDGSLIATSSGSRGEVPSISLFRISPAGVREAFAAGIRNATSLAWGPDGGLYVSSRFEGVVFRVDQAGHQKLVATDLGVPTGLAFDAQGRLYVGDRSGTIRRVDHGHVTVLASLPPSVAAYHLAFRPDGALVVAAPTLSSVDGLYQVTMDGAVTRLPHRFGRPQGLACDGDGVLHVVDALAGDAAVYRVPDAGPPVRVATGAGLIGLAFGPAGTVALATEDAIFRLTHL